MLSFRSVALTAAVTLLSVPAGGQVWQSVTPANGTAGYTNPNGYWNNSSTDNLSASDVCNIGSLLTSTTQNCGSQQPANLLPLGSGVTGLTTGNARYLGNGSGGPVRFGLGAGVWDISFFGRIAGASMPVDVSFVLFNADNSSFTTLTVGSTVRVTTSSSLLFGLASYNPTGSNQRGYLSSMQTTPFPFANTILNQNATQQWAVFTDAGNATSLNGMLLRNAGTYWIAGEDNACNRSQNPTLCADGSPNARNEFSDWDYNDAIIRATAVVPEPSTYALLATGLIGLAGVVRRRRGKD
jgi:hypothetical protein